MSHARLPQLILKKNKDIPIRSRHMWIFSGAVENSSSPSLQDGVLVEVLPYDRSTVLGYAIINRKSKIIGRIVSFTNPDIHSVIRDAIVQAFQLRRSIYPEIDQSDEEMYRLVNAEGDGLSGLIVDMYGRKTAVLQISSLAMEKYRDCILKTLIDDIGVSTIYERSNSSSRKIEGLVPREGCMYGVPSHSLIASERGIRYKVDVEKGQKTGFFLDQREMRSLIRSLSFQKKVINCFSYSGGFSLNALLGQAQHVLSIDVSSDALSMLDQSIELNAQIQKERHKSLAEDVFRWLEKPGDETGLSDCDILILDPPAFAKTQKDIPKALTGYKEINRRAFQKMKRGSLLLTCSCSYHITPEQFQEMLFKAACSANRDIRVVSQHRNALDHMSTIYHRETDYLKSTLISIM